MADQAAKDRQNIIDAFDKMAPGHQVQESEIAQFIESSDYQLQKYIRNLPEYINSAEFQDRLTSILSQAQAVFGTVGQDEATFRQIGQWIRAGVTDNQIIWGWRNSAGYKQMYAGKPDYMTESQYRTIKEKMVAEAPGLANDFSTYAGRNLSQDEINKIYFGGEGSDQIRQQYVQVQGIKASNQAMIGKRLGTQVQLTPGGPTQPLMAGRQSATGSGVPQQPQIGTAVSQNPLPPTERYSTYQDLKKGIVNPEYERRATPFKI